MAKQGAGIAGKPPVAKKGGKKKQKTPGYDGLNKQQAQVINQTNQGDVALGGAALGQMPGIEQSYSQPFDYSQLPESPWAQGQTIQDMEGQYYDRALSNYDRSMQDQYKQQDEEFDQQMSNRGIPLGSELYNKLKTQTATTRDSARQNAMDSAYFNAGQNATNWNNIGTQNFQNAYGFAQDQRNQPLADYTRLMGAQSGFGAANLGYSQQRGLQQQAGQIQASMPRGGGGGGGGGTPPVWQQWGAASPQEFAAQQEQIRRDNQQWEWSNNPQYKGQKQPSPWASLGGSALGIGLGAFAGSMF